MAAVSSVIALGGVALGAVAGAAQADALNRQSKAIGRAAEAEQDAYRRAQDLLEKNKEEAITDIEGANLKAQGLISDSEEAAITGLNATEKGAIETLKEFTEKSDELFASTEQLVVKDLVDSGVIAREDINKSTQEAIETVVGFNEKAIEAFKPFTEAGKRGLERQQFLAGLLDEDEKASHIEKFGAIEGSPIFEFRKKEASEALARKQKAIGRVFSGKALDEELKVINTLTAEESERARRDAIDLSQIGLQATGQVAGIQQQTGQQVAGLQQARGINLANQATTQGQNIASTRQSIGLNRANLQNQLGTNISNIQLSLGQARARVRQNALLNKAKLAESLGTSKANIRTGQSAQQAGILAQSGSQQANRIAQQANLSAQSQLAPFQGVISGLQSGANILGFQQGQQNFNNLGLPTNNPQFFSQVA